MKTFWKKRKKKVSPSTINLITDDVLKKLEIEIPIKQEDIGKLLDYFYDLEVFYANGEDENYYGISHDALEQICHAVDDFSVQGETIDLDDLNARLKKLRTKNGTALVKLSDMAVEFIKKYAMTELQLSLPIGEEEFDEIFEFATYCEMDMIDTTDENYVDKTYDYPEKERDEMGDKFVAEVSCADADIDLADLNARLTPKE